MLGLEGMSFEEQVWYKELQILGLMCRTMQNLFPENGTINENVIASILIFSFVFSQQTNTIVRIMKAKTLAIRKSNFNLHTL